MATEEDRVDTRKVTPARSRVAAEDLVLQYAHDAGLPAVSDVCVDNLRRPGSHPHTAPSSRARCSAAAFTMRGIRLEVVVSTMLRGADLRRTRA